MNERGRTLSCDRSARPRNARNERTSGGRPLISGTIMRIRERRPFTILSVCREDLFRTGRWPLFWCSSDSELMHFRAFEQGPTVPKGKT